MRSLSRRTILRSACGAAVALPLLEAMAPKKARAQASGLRRVIFEFKPNGDQVDRRFAQLGTTDFELDEFLEPLAPYRKDLLFLDRINKNFHRIPQSTRGDQHQQGGSSLSPWEFGEGDFPVGGEDRTVGYVLGPSADYAIGTRVQEAHPSVPYRHHVFRVGGEFNDIWNLHAHAGPPGTKNPVPPETDPYLAYTRLFGFLNQEGTEAELLHRISMEQSVLDLVSDQLKSLSEAVSSQDRQRLELHAEAIRDLEKTLSRGISSPECKGLDLGPPVEVYDDDSHLELANAFFRLIALSFSCDLTRVINFNWSGNTSQRVYRSLGITEPHHEISHRSDEASFEQIRKIHRHLWQHTTSLYQELLSVPEGEGTLWDQTLIVHYNELGQGDVHSTHDNLVVLAGGAGGAIRSNQRIDFEQAGAFSDLLVAVFHYMGFEDVSVFGDERLSDGSGPLPGILR